MYHKRSCAEPTLFRLVSTCEAERKLAILSPSVGRPAETCLRLRRHNAGLGGDQAMMLDASVAGEIEHGFLAETRGTLVSRTMSASGESRLTSAEQAGGV